MKGWVIVNLFATHSYWFWFAAQWYLNKRFERCMMWSSVWVGFLSLFTVSLLPLSDVKFLVTKCLFCHWFFVGVPDFVVIIYVNFWIFKWEFFMQLFSVICQVGLKCSKFHIVVSHKLPLMWTFFEVSDNLFNFAWITDFILFYWLI